VQAPTVAAALANTVTALSCLFDDDAARLIDEAIEEAQNCGDPEIGGQHVLLAMCLRRDGAWLALRWAGASARALTKAALQATSEGALHPAPVPFWREIWNTSRDGGAALSARALRVLGDEPEGRKYIPFSQALRRALEDGSQMAVGQPLTPPALLAVLVRTEEPVAARTIADAGLLPEDILSAIAALSHLGDLDPLAGHLARPPTDAQLSPRAAIKDHQYPRAVTASDAGSLVAHSDAADGWTAPEREAAMSIRQFQLAAASLPYLLLVLVTVGMIVSAAKHGYGSWLLLLAPLVAIGSALGTWALIPFAALFWWLQLPTIAWLVLAITPLELISGALIRLRQDLQNAPAKPRCSADLRIRARHVLGTFLHGYRVTRR
jgi:Clp amino terminal domain, pathogenicity island component